MRDGTLYVQAFDDANNVMTGAARPVASPVPTSDRRSAFSASPAGPMAYRKGRMDGAQLWWLARNGARLEAFGSPIRRDFLGQCSRPPVNASPSFGALAAMPTSGSAIAAAARPHV